MEREKGIGESRKLLSNEKRAPGCLGYIGDEFLPSYIGIIMDYFISHEIRIPINQPGFNGK